MIDEEAEVCYGLVERALHRQLLLGQRLCVISSALEGVGGRGMARLSNDKMSTFSRLGL